MADNIDTILKVIVGVVIALVITGLVLRSRGISLWPPKD